MTARQRLPNRRASRTFDLEANGLRYTCTYSTFVDGRPSELFLSNHKSNSAADSNARDAAVVCSIALQYGVPLDVIRKALLRDSQGRASTPLGVALDYIARENEP
jgi:ribonucleoside-diphosphate reductase alpha chain